MMTSRRRPSSAPESQSYHGGAQYHRQPSVLRTTNRTSLLLICGLAAIMLFPAILTYQYGAVFRRSKAVIYSHLQEGGQRALMRCLLAAKRGAAGASAM
eukprot:scaffold463365_cov14-Prasinocladus_malaysianus.AAC.1